jgi:uncharacterized repeat protein (TIGR03803 family)
MLSLYSLRWFFVLVTSALTGAFCNSVASGAAYNVLYNFAGGTADGANPFGSLTPIGSIFYGMTSAGGASGNGTIFTFNPATGVETPVYFFNGLPADGANPQGSLTQSTTNSAILYGLTQEGGSAAEGTAFSFDTTNNTENILFNFGHMVNGPTASVTQSGPMLYGLARDLFSIDTANNNLETTTVLSLGTSENSTLVQVGSVLYGLSGTGGTGNDGTIFSYDLTTNQPTILHSFTGSPNDGAGPMGSLTLSGTTLYGTTTEGGNPGGGTIFSYNFATGSYETLFTFGNGGNGAIPEGDLLVDGSTLYGMALAGPDSDGVIFSFDLNTDTETVLHSFDTTDGRNPTGDLTLVGNTLYGMTPYGGEYGDGVIFSIAVPEPATLSLLTAGGSLLLLRRGARRGN